MEIPPGALEQDTVITITQAERTPSPSDVHVYPVGTGFNIYPACLAFKKPVKLTFKVNEADLPKAGVSDLLSMAVGCWNGNAYDALPSYPYFRESRMVGFIHALPDNLKRPDRPAHAMTRTAPVENYQYPSNYFSLITIKEAKPIILGERPAGFTIDIGGSHGIDPARLFVIDGKNERLLLDVDGIAADKGSHSLTHLMETGTVLTNEWNGGPLPQGVSHRIGITGTAPKANRAVLASAFYATPPLNLSAIKIFPEEAKLAENSELRFIGVGISSDGTEIPGLPFSWSVEGSDAKIDPFGSLTSKGEQKAKIQASYAGLTAHAGFQVKGKPVLTDILFAPQIQVVRVNEERDYRAIGVDQYGHRMEFEPEWSIRQDGGDGEINPKTGHFKAKTEGIFFIKVRGDHGVSRQEISFIGGCTWCHFKGKQSVR